MRLLKTLTVLSLSLVTCCAARPQQSSKLLKQHVVWIQKGISWDRMEGDDDPHRSYAGAKLLYFGPDGKFGTFQGIVIKTQKGMAMSEGDGEIVFGGDWKVVNDEISVSYRLISWYKIILKEGQKPPVVPGDILHGEIRLEKEDARSGSTRELEFEGKKYEPESGFKAADLRSHLQIHDQHPLGGQQ